MSKAKGKQTVVETPVVEPVEQEVETVQNGCFIYPDGSKYEGEWTLVDGNQVRNGKGTFTCGPDQYSGNWSNDAMDGEGEYFFSSGAIYRGNFTLNLFHGLGEYVFPDGATYSGSWSGGKMHGVGVYTDPDGVQWNGNFFNGMYDSGRSYLSLRPGKTLV